MFFIGAAICYIVLMILVLKATFSFNKSVSHDRQDITPLFSQKSKRVLLCLVSAFFLFTFLAFFALTLKSGESIWASAAAGALNCILLLLKPRNLILFGLLLLLLLQDKKRKDRRSADHE